MKYKKVSTYDYEVQDLNDAIALAEKWKKEGRFDWFRGQTKSWPLLTTLIRRIKSDEYEDSEFQVHHFLDWFHRNESFKGLLDQKDAFWAVAQHYGLPTNFLDFTTDPKVAGFFAWQGNKSIGEKGCIFCLSTQDFSEFKEMIAKADSEHAFNEIELLDIPVDNLWRHQAQSGKFMYLPLEGLERMYNVERIFFTHRKGIEAPIAPSLIYPSRKSSLEIALDEFFEERRLLKSQQNFRKIIDTELFKTQVLDVPKNFQPQYFKDGKLPRHSSWQKNNTKIWYDVGAVEFNDYYSFQKIMYLDIKIELLNSLDQTIISLVSSLQDKLLLVKWRCRIDSIEDASFIRRLNMSLNRIWEALRYYPYSTEERAQALAQTVRFAIIIQAKGKHLGHEHEVREALRAYDNNLLLIDLGKDDGAFNKSLISPEPFLNSVRNNIWNFLKDEFRPIPNPHTQMKSFLMAVRNPSYLFSFSAFKKAYVNEVIPYQVLAESFKDSVVFYNPADIDVFGLS
ncbi:MAG: FRG domain-containing protein [Bacteroidota bacterium]